MSNMLTPIAVPEKVDFSLEGDGAVRVKGPMGEMRHRLPEEIKVSFDAGAGCVKVERARNDRKTRALHGLHRSLLANMVEGVSRGFEKAMEVHGTGYNVNVQGNRLVLKIGFCHDVNFDIPENMSVEIDQKAAQPGNPARFRISGTDKHQVGQFAANIRKVRPPEPYKGKGVRYADEHVARKEGKAFAGLE